MELTTNGPFSRIECSGDLRAYDEVLSYHLWRHRIPIAQGFVTPGYLNDAYWDQCHFPTQLKGGTVLDVGANDGLNSFHFERIGASRVVGVDLYHDSNDQSHTKGWTIQGALMAKKYLNSKVEFVRKSAYDVEELGEKYDVVLLADVMNWLTDIPRALGAISSVCKDTFIIRDGLMHKNKGDAFLEYVHRPDYDLMFLPNRRFMEVILKQLGFKHVEFHRIDAEQLLEDWVADYPLASAKGPISVYASPYREEVLREEQPQSVQVISKVGERIMLRGLGWVNVSDVEVQRIERRAMARMARNVLGDKLVTKIKRSLYPQRDAAYTIIARR